MGTDFEPEFDASVGLAFSLRAFGQYRKSGTFSAEVRGIPGMRGQGQAYIELWQGKVVSCFVIDRQGERHTPGHELLARLDEERGPFKWVFHRDTGQQTTLSRASDPQLQASSQAASPSPIFRPLIPYLEARHLQSWTSQQQQYLCAIYTLIDGRNSLADIKLHLALHPRIVDEGIRVLLLLKVIAV